MVFHQAVLRGGKIVQNNVCRTPNSASEFNRQKSIFRLRRWLIGILIFLLMFFVIINSYATGQFRIIHFGNIEKEDLEGESNERNIVKI